MSSDHPTPIEKQQAAEAAAIRRRLSRLGITLGEAVAVIAVLISALTLWNSWKERSDTASERSSQEKQGAARAATLTLSAKVADGGKRLALAAVSNDQTIQSQSVEFPSALAVDVAETAGEPRIEGSWFEEALKKARAAAGRPDDSRGDERLPVAITTRFLADGHLHEDRAIYDVGYSASGKLIAGHNIRLSGLSLVARVRPIDLRARLDARWAGMMPAKE